MNIVAAWLFSVALQSVLLLIAAFAIERMFTLRNAWRELLWRGALFGGVLTATLQMFSVQAPLAGRWSMPAEQISVASAQAITASTARSTNPIVAPTRITAAPSAIPPMSTRVQIPLGSSVSKWVIAVWAIVALLMLMRVAMLWWRMRGLFADAMPLADEALIADAATIADRANIAPPALFIMDALPSPVALHGARIVLPRWAVESLDRAQLRAMIAHETAHIARRDPEWKALTAFWRAIFWFVPATFAQRRLDDVAELACDSFAATCLGNARGLAECLALCAEHHVGAHTFDLVPAMAARPSSLIFRIDRLLEGTAMETTSSGIGARAVVLLTLVTTALALPAIGVDAGIAHASSVSDVAHSGDKKSTSSISVHSDDRDESTIISQSDDHGSFTANIHGKFTMSDDETDVIALSDGGTAKLEQNVGASKQRIDLSERGGKLEHHYFVDNVERPYDDKARAFMTTVATELERSGVNAEARAKRLYAQGGAKRVLDEIGHLHSDYVGGIYLRTLSGTGQLAPNDLDRAVTLAGNFDSDYERRQTLTLLFETQSLDASGQVALLKQVARLSSDYDHAEMLVAVVPRLDGSQAVRQAWFDAANGLHSDYELRRAYEAMLAHDGADDRQIASVIAASASMNSDYDHGELLKLAAKRTRNVDAIAADYVKSADEINSEYTRREVLTALIETDHAGARAAGAVLDSAANIQSPYERAQLLISLARVMPTDAKLVERYRDLASQLPSSERGDAENALVR